LNTLDGVDTSKTVLALIAAYNEADRISATISAVKDIPAINHVLVVDDGSTDETTSVAREAGAEVLRLNNNVGKGGALKAAVSGVKQDVVLFIDADLGKCAGEAAKLLRPVLSGEADMAIADFPKAKIKGGFGFAKGLGRWGIRHFTDIVMSEPLSGQRVVKTDLLKDIKFESGYGLEVGMSIDILKKGCRVIEVPVEMTHRETGRDLEGIIHRGRQFIDIFGVILRRILSDI
jgi:glycosyltransferase involved in cell wall biosynthesis